MNNLVRTVLYLFEIFFFPSIKSWRWRWRRKRKRRSETVEKFIQNIGRIHYCFM